MTIGSEIRHAVRSLSRQKRFAIGVILTLAVAIGANAAVFHVVNLTLLRPLPFAESEALFRIQASMTMPSGAASLVAVSQQAFARLRDARIFDSVVAQRLENLVVRTPTGEPKRVVAIRVSSGWTQLFGVRPALGRGFNDEDDRLGAGAASVLLSHSLWERDFGADPSVLGRAIVLEDRAVTVVGVMPPAFNYPYQAELWLPMTVDPNAGTPGNLNVIGRLRRGSTIESTREQLRVISMQLAREAPQTNAGRILRATPLRTDLSDNQDRLLVALLGAVAFVMLIAAANIASLFLTRAVHRRREMAVRAALGATTFQRARAVLCESSLLAVLGGIAGALIASWIIPIVTVLMPRPLRELGVQGAIDVRMTVFVVGVTLVSGFVFGVLPALRLAGATSLADLGSGTRSTGTHTDRRLLEAVVVAEIAMALLLSICAAQLFDHVRRAESAHPGFRATGALSMGVPLSDRRLQTAEARIAFLRRVDEELRTIPGVTASGLTSLLPVGGGNALAQVSIDRGSDDRVRLSVNHRAVSPGYFGAMGVPILRGRDFDDRDRPDSQPVVIVSTALAERFWPGDEPLGKRIKRGAPADPNPWLTVIGIVGNIREPEEAVPETWYLPYTQQVNAFTGFVQPVFVLRAEIDAASLAQSARAAIARVDASVPVFNVSTLDDLNAGEFASERLGTNVMSAFAAGGLLLVLLGVYGVTRYGVSQRLQEFGVRMAFGARAPQIVWMVLRQAAWFAFAGIALGLPGALIASRALEQIAPGVASRDPVLFLIPMAGIALATLLAAGFPAWRATRIDPATALRERT
jgi:putative ABC transport system permease protein